MNNWKPSARRELIEQLRTDQFAAAVQRAPAHLVARLGRSAIRVIDPDMPARPKLRDVEECADLTRMRREWADGIAALERNGLGLAALDDLPGLDLDSITDEFPP